ncbi:hypothetical protein [uncultured Oscillibacter sp.]|uniref:DUF4376 domain-containing protein n=1 Tax=uncultured Oscillibacter sp. TaxID=876091 RepID=UPI0025D9951A|nr:hypothetical protein [uncultured Oscillibacter sp.]
MERKQCYLIDANGIYMDIVVAIFEEDAPIRLETVAGPRDVPEGCTVLPMETATNHALSFVKAKWNGSAWTEGATAKEIAAWEKAHPGPSLAQVQADKLAEINAGCDAAIAAGCVVTLSDGTEGHISLTLPDQINLSTAQAAILGGGTGYAYHLDGALCEVYPAADIAIMARAATAHVLYHQTYCNHARAWAKRSETVADVQAITYGVELPEDLAAHMAAVLAAAEGGNA